MIDHLKKMHALCKGLTVVQGGKAPTAKPEDKEARAKMMNIMQQHTQNPPTIPEADKTASKIKQKIG